MDQKHLEHILRVRKINPDLGRGFWDGGHMGPGIMHQRMMGPGGKGNWGPDNCPFGGHVGGYGMGSRKMYRSGYGKSLGEPGRDCSRRYDKGQGSQME